MRKNRQGTRDVVLIGRSNAVVDLKEAIDETLLDENSRNTQAKRGGIRFLRRFRVLSIRRRFWLLVSPAETQYLVDAVEWTLTNGSGSTPSYVTKNHYAALNLIANNNWVPHILCSHHWSGQLPGLQDHFRLEGLAYRLVPLSTGKRQSQHFGSIGTDIMFDNVEQMGLGEHG